MTDHEHPDEIFIAGSDNPEAAAKVRAELSEKHRLDESRITPAGALRATAIDYANSADENPYITEKLLNAADQIEALTARPAAAEAAAYRKAAEWHNNEIAKVKSQIDDNNAYARRMRDKGHSCHTTDAANENCRSAIYYLEKSRAAILALADQSALDEALAAEREKYQAVIESLIGHVEGQLEDGCPACGGDCSSANPPVSFCPVRIMMDDISKARAAIRKGDQA